MKLIKLSAVIFVISCFMACNTDRPYEVYFTHEGTPTNADTVLYNLHHEKEAPGNHGKEASGHHEDVQEHLPRVFWR